MAKPGRKPATPTASPDTSTPPATKSKSAGKAHALDASGDRFTGFLDAMNTMFGKGTLRAIDADSDEAVVDVISTGSLNLDIALGIGGYPRGRIVEIYGPESSGKTTLTLHAIANAQKLGLQCVFIDAEHALDVKYAKALGVDTRKLLISQPDSGEAALDLLDQACKSGGVDVIIVDSIAALTPKAELDGDMTQSHVGLQARMMSRIMRKIASSAAKGNVLVILINQIRMKIGVMFGSPETTPGGNAVKFFSSVRLDIRRIGGVKEGGSETFTGNATKVTVKKNKMAPPFKEVEFPIVFGVGIDNVGEMMDMGKEHGIFSLQKVDRSGAGNCWFYDPPADAHGVIDTEKTIKLGNSREPAKVALSANPALQAEVRQRLLDKLLTVKTTGTTEADRAALAAKIESEKYVPEAGIAVPGAVVAQDEDEDPLAAVAAYAAEGDE